MTTTAIPTSARLTAVAMATKAFLPTVDGTVVNRPLTSSITEGNGTALVHTRATAQTIVDHEGIVRTILSGETGFTGARRVYNEIGATSSEDLTTGWGGQVGATIDSATTLTLPNNNSYANLIHNDIGAGSFIYSIVLWTNSGTGSMRIGYADSSDGVPDGNVDITITTIPTRFYLVIPYAATMGGDLQVEIGHRTGLGNTYFSQFNVDKAMLERVDGQTDTTTPSEYVSKGVLSAPWHGANADAIKWFDFDNGNSVASNIVTEARGTDLTGITGILLEEARTNSAIYSRDFTNAAWVATNITPVKDATGLDGTASGASTLTADAGNGTIFQTITLGSAAYTTSFWVRRKTGTGTIEITDNNGTNYTTTVLTTTYQRFDITRTQANPVIGFRIVTSGDEIEVDFSQCEAGSFPTSVIETTTAATTRNSSDLTASSAGLINDSEGSVLLEWTPYYDKATDGLSVGILSVGTNGRFFYRNSTEVVKSYDGTNIVSSTTSFVAGTTYKLGLSWSGTTKKIFINGTKDGEGTYVGSWNDTGTLYIGNEFGSDFNQDTANYKNLRIYTKALSDAEMILATAA